ncbi:hypothetical protein E2320_021111 [Naja naja]|nr:hypothetical protein E2320_021111 [Naja naja]
MVSFVFSTLIFPHWEINVEDNTSVKDVTMVEMKCLLAGQRRMEGPGSWEISAVKSGAHLETLRSCGRSVLGDGRPIPALSYQEAGLLQVS